MKDLKPVDTLVRDLADFHTRARARQLLCEMEDPPIAALQGVLEDPEAPLNMKWAAITVLEAHHCREALPLLLDLMKREQNLAGEVNRALQTITGSDVGEDTDQWEAVLAAADTDTGGGSESEQRAVRVVRDALQDEAATVSWDAEQGCVYLELPLGNRRQQVIVSFDSKDANGNDAILVYTECGIAPTAKRDSILTRNASLRYGVFELEEQADGSFRVAMRHILPCAGLLPGDFHDVIVSVAREADALEYELTGTDRI